MFSPLVANLLAALALLVLVLGLAAWAVVALRRMPFTPVQSILWGVNYLLVRVLWRVRIEGRMDIPAGQGAVVICNHRSPIDPCFIEITTIRAVDWMVAKEYWANPIMAWFFRTVKAIPVSRAGVDTAATKTIIRNAQQGELVALFPEGRINTTKQFLLPGRPGVALIALRARVPVIPCYLEGSPNPGTTFGPLITPAKVRLVIGRPIDLTPYYERDDREVLEELTMQFLREIAKLAGHPEFEPSLAGRFYRPDLAEKEANGGNGTKNGTQEEGK
jgi:1-acyl-sn-glycerol-3-phosphate acyltransferase